MTLVTRRRYHSRMADTPAEHNTLGLNYRTPLPRPPVRGMVIDFHTHLLAARHARPWFEAMRHYGIDACLSMTPLDEALALCRDWPGRLHFIAVPKWLDGSPHWLDNWLRHIDAFFNIGSRLVKFHLAPRTLAERKTRLDEAPMRRIMRHARDRGMILMSHIGDPDTWYQGKYADAAKYGTRDQHYAMWEAALQEHRDWPWLGAHLGGNPENLPRLQALLDRFPNLYLDCSATRWMVREISARRDQARDFFIRNQDRIIFGSDQVSGDQRGFDFLASRLWCQRKLWETAYVGPSPIHDPDCPADAQPMLRGLALPVDVLQKLYRDNALALLARAQVTLDEPMLLRRSA